MFGAMTQATGVAELFTFTVSGGGTFRLELDSTGQILLYNNSTTTNDDLGGVTTTVSSVYSLFPACNASFAAGRNSWYRLLHGRLRLRCVSSIQSASGMVFSYHHPAGPLVPLRTIRDYGVLSDASSLQASTAVWHPLFRDNLLFQLYQAGDLGSPRYPVVVSGFHGVNCAAQTFVLDFELRGECIASAMTDVVKPASGGIGDPASGIWSLVKSAAGSVKDVASTALNLGVQGALTSALGPTGTALANSVTAALATKKG